MTRIDSKARSRRQAYNRWGITREMSSKQDKPKTDYDGSTPLKSVMQEMFISNILAGMNQTEAYHSVYKCKTRQSAQVSASQLLCNPIVKARVDHEKRVIAEISRLEVAYCQYRLLKLADLAQAEKKYSTARACIADIIKTKGGFKQDEPGDEAIKLKQMDASVRLEIAAVLNRHIDSTYLSAKPVDNTIVSCSSGCSDSDNSALLEQE